MVTFVDLHRLEAGYRFCTHCGRPELPPHTPEWKTVCGGCYVSMKRLSHDEQYAKGHCTDCGAPIEPEILNFAKSVGRRLRDCQSCYRDANARKKPSQRLALIDSLRNSLPAA